MLLVKLRYPTTNLARAESNHRVGAGVVINWTMKDLDSQGSLFQLVCAPGKSFFYDISQQSGIALAAAEWRAQKDSVQFLLYLVPFRFGNRNPSASCRRRFYPCCH